MAYTQDPGKLIDQLRHDLARSNQRAIDLQDRIHRANDKIEMLEDENERIAKAFADYARVKVGTWNEPSQAKHIFFEREDILKQIRNPTEDLKIMWAGDFHPSHLDAIALGWQYGIDKLLSK